MKTDNKSARGGGKSTVRRGNVLDLFILLLLVASIIGIGYRYYTKTHPARADMLTDAEISFEIKSAVFTLPSYVKAGDVLYFEDGTVFGTVMDNSTEEENTALYVTPATVLTTDENGNYIRITYPDSSRVDCMGKLRCTGVFEEDGAFLLDGTRYITGGTALTVHTETASFVLNVTSCTFGTTN